MEPAVKYRNITTQPVEINNRPSKVTAFVVNSGVNLIANANVNVG